MKPIFKKYTPDNYSDYVRIFKDYHINLKKVNSGTSYCKSISKSGFLVEEPNAKDSDIMNQSPFHLCAFANNQVVGLIRLDLLEKNPDKKGITWIVKGEGKQIFEKGETLYIGVVMVDKNYKGHGIAQSLLDKTIKFLQENHYKYLFSFVVSKPKNVPSLTFHKKNGFKHIATYNAPLKFGIEHFESWLLAKKLSTF